MIPRFKPWIDHNEISALFRRNRNAVERFEKEFARVFNAVEAVAFPYGRSALYTFFKSVGLSDAEIIMPAYTCSVVAHAIKLSGNIPKFVDIRLFDYNMDLEQFVDSITEKTHAIIATHLFGYPLDLDILKSIVTEAEIKFGHKIWIVQDCAHSFGATWRGQLVGSSGDVALYALNISKMITSIFGGMLTFQNPELAAKARVLRDSEFRNASMCKAWIRRLYILAAAAALNEKFYGMTWWLQERTSLLNKLTKSYHLDEKIHFPPDAFDRMLDIEAAVGLEQLKKYPQIVEKKRRAAIWYDQNLERHAGWVFPPIVDGATYSHYVVRVPDRKRIIEAFAKEGIHLGELIQYSIPELREYDLYRGEASYPLSRISSLHTINFPMHMDLEIKNLIEIAKCGRHIE